jgi:hypothetical protein
MSSRTLGAVETVDDVIVADRGEVSEPGVHVCAERIEAGAFLGHSQSSSRIGETGNASTL